MTSLVTSPDTLRRFRIFKGFKQQTVANKLGISQPAFCKQEQGNYISEKRVIQILTILNSNLDELKAFEKLM